jgi:hypothetical protein
MATDLQKPDLKALAEAIFFYVASTRDNEYELPESMTIDEFANSIVEHISTKFEIDKDEVNDKTERIINDFLIGR